MQYDKINTRIHQLSSKLTQAKLNQKELNELATLITPKLKSWVSRYCNNTYDICEATQFTLIKIFSNLEKFDINKAKFMTWACTIAKNETLYYLYYKDKYTYLNIEDISKFKKDESQLEPNKKEIFDSIFSKTIDAILNIKDKQLKEIAELKMIKNKKIKEISTLLNINENTVKTKIRKIKKDIKYSVFLNHPEVKENIKYII